ncbi:unnamed protein product [Saimiriine gammaherpesvirus 2]|uniref:Bcl-2-like gene 16 protein n=1 Tax=Saimiriine herpesvirus 2 (strain 11) TaxID=10383 RepID=VG16_SHV21|nr:unnamed protein product [Saimiriine gammaherpesvirus 2]Q01001.1 RecName: Full=Bcl-2-like gene 16 protein [Herpesvirus saimiri (strain 11)]pir/G36807/ hypothetical protein ORF16 - saimiriine herpesvirus 1 (strain 11) [Saimiriine alphaherpesvirus 1]CAA45639.1 unnamed protein product [Saimiriine gammaherpesvirus 2]
MSSIKFQNIIENILKKCQDNRHSQDSVVRAVHSVIHQYNKFEALMPDFSLCVHDRIKFTGEAILLTTEHTTNWGKVVAMLSFSAAVLQTIDEEYKCVATSMLSSYISRSVGANWFIENGGEKSLVEFCNSIMPQNPFNVLNFLVPAVLAGLVLMQTLLIK